jgi:hypothetical protein
VNIKKFAAKLRKINMLLKYIQQVFSVSSDTGVIHRVALEHKRMVVGSSQLSKVGGRYSMVEPGCGVQGFGA